MKLNELETAAGSRKSRYRKGRGTGSGNGKTAGRGMNGQKSRSGGTLRIGFEGGQTPLYRRLPKRGFTNAKFKKVYTIVNLSQLNSFDDGAVVTPELLLEKKVISKLNAGVKILGNGTLEKTLTVKAHKFSSSAEQSITAKKGKIEVM